MLHAIAISSTPRWFLTSPMNRVFIHRYHCFQLPNALSTIRCLFTILA
jgi:hypothetical protein